MPNTIRNPGLLFGLILALSGCASWEGSRGVEPVWRQPAHQEWEVGTATDSDVADALGPPSQIIALQDQTVFYYVHEKSKGQAYIFILWNSSEESVVYDRAIFFFDKKGILEKYSYSNGDAE